jgi:hypothetical protein
MNRNPNNRVAELVGEVSRKGDTNQATNAEGRAVDDGFVVAHFETL